MSDDPPDPRDTISYTAESETYRAEFVHSFHPPSRAVVEVIAAITEQEPTQLTPLYQVLDPEALDGLVQKTAATGEGSNFDVSFTYLGHVVVVEGCGTIVVRTRDEVS